MREISAFAESSYEIFRHTHVIVMPGMGGAAWYERRHLPREGGADDQDALEMQALDALQLICNGLIQESFKARDTQKKFKTKRMADDR